MSVKELLNQYEKTVTFDAYILGQDNPALREHVSELRGAWEHRAILRILRVRPGFLSAVETDTASQNRASVARTTYMQHVQSTLRVVTCVSEVTGLCLRL